MESKRPSARAAVKAGEAAREAGRLAGEHGDGSGAAALSSLGHAQTGKFQAIQGGTTHSCSVGINADAPMETAGLSIL
jgi:hypothetical protein